MQLYKLIHNFILPAPIVQYKFVMDWCSVKPAPLCLMLVPINN